MIQKKLTTSASPFDVPGSRTLRNGNGICSGEHKSRRVRESDRKISIEEYLDQPRLPSAVELAASRSEIKRLRQELAVANYRNGNKSELAPIMVEVIGNILELSQRLFPGPVSYEYSFDPESPTDQWLVFNVVARGQYADYRDREFEWHEEVEKIVPGALCEFRLCVMPQR